LIRQKIKDGLELKVIGEANDQPLQNLIFFERSIRVSTISFEDMSSELSPDRPEGRLQPTRRSLLGRLRNWEDQASWREFFDTYWKFIYGVAIRSGLNDQEAEDVVQETVLSIARKMPDYVYDPTRCTFKGWIMHVTRLRIVDQFRRRPPPGRGRTVSDEGSRLTDLIERVPDLAASARQEAMWEEEWERNLVDAAMERVKIQVKPAHFQIFHLSAVKGMKAAEVARMLQVGVGQVYLVRHRVGNLVKQEVEKLRGGPT
jgi:RNA polymerase sigma-70 factor (ECF subfamily)